MFVTSDVSKLLTFNDVSAPLLPNISCISVTFEVLKLSTCKLLTRQLLNMNFMSVTEAVLKLLTSKAVRLSQLLNIYCISVTLLVSHFETSIVDNFLQPKNIYCIYFAEDVSKLLTFKLVKLEQSANI